MKDLPRHRVIDDFRYSRWELIELLSIAVLIGLSISFFSRSIYSNISEIYSLSGASIFLIVSIVLIFARRIRNLSHDFVFEGFLIKEKESHKIKSVPGYDLAENISRYQRSAFHENEALQRQWEEEPLEEYFSYSEDGEYLTFNEDVASYQLLSEMLEYFVLDELSTHLIDYFNKNDISESKLKKYKRPDIPQILLNNRFLELFSKPMEDRPAFSQYGKTENVVYAGGAEGPLFSRFKLVLPSESDVERLEDGNIEIEGKYLRILFRSTWTGGGAVMPRLFEKHYLGVEDTRNISVTTVKFGINVQFKYSSLLTRTGWKHYKWVESFISKIEESVDKQVYFKRINWPMIEALLRCQQSQTEKPLEVEKRMQHNPALEVTEG